jgi:hypothetical protein
MKLICKRCKGTGISCTVNPDLLINSADIFFLIDKTKLDKSWTYKKKRCSLCKGDSIFHIDWIDLIFEHPELYDKNIYEISM